MKTKAVIMTMFMTFSLTTKAATEGYTGTTVNNVWSQIQSDTYELPKNKISLNSLWKYGISKMANRTLDDKNDILPQFQKLAHPNGVCLKGAWKIDTENEYSGFYKNGSEGVLIARASVAMSKTTVGSFRGFGLAGKLYPTTNEFHSENLKTANFFTVDDLGGTKAPHFTGVELTNEPAVSKTPTVVANLFYALKLAAAFGKADKNPGIRQVYQIAELGESDLKNIVTPKWMMLRAKKGQTVDAKDFRDELNIANYNGSLVFEILVANVDNKETGKNWKKIGTINFNDSEVSNSCDHRLHFNHPKWRTDLKHSK